MPYDRQVNLKTWRHLSIAQNKIYRVTIAIPNNSDRPHGTIKHYMVAAQTPNDAISMMEHLFNDCPHQYEITAQMEKFYIPKVWAADGLSAHHTRWYVPRNTSKDIIRTRRNPTWEEMLNL